MTTPAVILPQIIIDVYLAAQDAYIKYEERTEQWRVGTLELFWTTLDEIINSAMANPGNPNDSSLRAAYAALNDIVSLNGGTPHAETPTGNVSLPDDVIGLYQRARDAFSTYSFIMNRLNLTHLPRFRDTLNHIIDAAQVPSELRIEVIANAKEHLVEIGAESYEKAARELLDRIRKDSLPIRPRWKFFSKDLSRYLKDLPVYSILPALRQSTRFLWRDFRSSDFIKLEVSFINSEIRQGRDIKGRIRDADTCINHMRNAVERAENLHNIIHERSFRLPLTILVGVLASIIAAVLLEYFGTVDFGKGLP